MRRLLLLALLSLALPTAALASSLDFNSGGFESGTINESFTSPFEVTVMGTGDTISLENATIIGSCAATAIACHFEGGSVTVTEDGSTVFENSVTGGTIFKIRNVTGNENTIVTATLVPNELVISGTVIFTNLSVATDDTLISGTAIAAVNAVPEPGTIGLLGTGLIGLAGLVRRKLKPGA